MIQTECNYYKHNKMRDVALYVTRKTYTERGLEVFGYWANIHYSELIGKEPDMLAPANLLLSPEEEAQWHLYDVEENKYRLKRK